MIYGVTQNANLPADHVGALHGVGVAVHEALDAGGSRSEGRLGVFPIVQVLSHIFN